MVKSHKVFTLKCQQRETQTHILHISWSKVNSSQAVIFNILVPVVLSLQLSGVFYQIFLIAGMALTIWKIMVFDMNPSYAPSQQLHVIQIIADVNEEIHPSPSVASLINRHVLCHGDICRAEPHAKLWQGRRAKWTASRMGMATLIVQQG